MMDNICPICGQHKNELQEQRSWTETDQYHGVKKFGLKQGAGFIAGQVADAIIPGLGTFASVAAKSLTGDYYDENHPKNKKHYYTYNYFKCNQCGIEWTRDSDGMELVDAYYSSRMKDYETPTMWLYWPIALPYGFLLAAIIINFIFAIFGLLFEWLAVSSSALFGTIIEWNPGDYFSSSWWPTLKWTAAFASFSWIYYAIYISTVLFFFLLPVLRHNSRVEDEMNAKKQVIADRLGINSWDYTNYRLLSKIVMWIGIVIVSALLIFGIKKLFNSSDSLYSTANNHPEESYIWKNVKSIKDNPEVVKFAQDYLTSLITGDTATAHKYYPRLRNAEFENGTTSEINSVREEKTDNGIFNIVSFEGGWMKIAREDNEYIIVDSEGLFPYKRKIQDLESKYGVDLSIYKNLSETDLVESTTFTSLALSYDHSEIVEQKRTQEEAKETSIPSSMAADVLTDILSLGFPELDKVHRYLERNGYSYIAPTINGKYYAKNCDCDVEEENETLFGADEEDVSYNCTPKNVNNQSVFVETESYRGPDNTSITVWGKDNYNRILEILQNHGYKGETGKKGISFESNGKPSIYLYRDRNYTGEAYTATISADSY